MKEEKKLPEDLEEAAERYNEMMSWAWEAPNYPHKAAFIAGAEWQKEQFEKNRLAACDAQTEEEYVREIGLVDKFVIGENRMPTFSDAINYGIEWQKAKMLEDAVEGIARPDDCEIWVNLVGYGYKFEDGDKVKIIIVRESN